MPIDPANANELATTAREVSAEVVRGNLRYPSDTGSWQQRLDPQASSSAAASCIRFQAAST